MYHAVGLPVSGKRDTFLNVPEESFRRQMRMLASLGYRTRTFGEILEAWRTGRTLPRRTFAVTFDDAYQCVATVAAPILDAYELKGTIFVVSSWADGSEESASGPGRANTALLKWQALTELVRSGWEIGGHTASHPHLDQLDDAHALDEIVSGNRDIERALGVTVRTFCYPFGHLNERTPRLVREAGLSGACTVRSGLANHASDLYRLPRVKVGYRDGVTGLLYQLLVRPILPTFPRHRRSHTLSPRKSMP